MTMRLHHPRHAVPAAAKVVAGAVGLFVLLTGAPAGLRAQGFSDLENRGFTIASGQCGSCHAVARSDVSPHPKAPPFRVIGRRYSIDSIAKSLADGIILGHVDMSEYKFRPDEVEALVAYLKYVQEPDRR
jgi:mono/diheme cytochrome c family protein